MMDPKIFKELATEAMTPQCTRVKLDQEFLSSLMNMPEGFCNWAWADIQRDVNHLATGGDFPWINTKGKMDFSLHRWIKTSNLQTGTNRVRGE